MSLAASVSGDERLRLFLALRLPDDVLDQVERWQREGRCPSNPAREALPPWALHQGQWPLDPFGALSMRRAYRDRGRVPADAEFQSRRMHDHKHDNHDATRHAEPDRLTEM